MQRLRVQILWIKIILSMLFCYVVIADIVYFSTEEIRLENPIDNTQIIDYKIIINDNNVEIINKFNDTTILNDEKEISNFIIDSQY